MGEATVGAALLIGTLGHGRQKGISMVTEHFISVLPKPQGSPPDHVSF